MSSFASSPTQTRWSDDFDIAPLSGIFCRHVEIGLGPRLRIVTTGDGDVVASTLRPTKDQS